MRVYSTQLLFVVVDVDIARGVFVLPQQQGGGERHSEGGKQSRLLGHTNIKTTQIYAKITAQKISQDMETLSHKLEDMEKNICRAI